MPFSFLMALQTAIFNEDQRSYSYSQRDPITAPSHRAASIFLFPFHTVRPRERYAGEGNISLSIFYDLAIAIAIAIS